MIPPLLIQPFNLVLQRYDYYLSTILKGHPEYDSIQALVMKRPNGPPLIRAVINRRDGSRIEHLNHEGIIRAHQASGRPQEVVYSPMVFSLEEAGGKPAAHLEFISGNKEETVLDLLCTRRPTPKLGGLMNPGSFAARTGLPLMWTDRVSFCSPQSRLTLGGRVWEIPPRSGGSLFRREVEALLCLGFSLGILGREHRVAELIGAPSQLLPGESWIFAAGPVQTVYRIVQQDGSSLAVRQEGPLPQTIMARIEENRLDILRIEAHSGPLDPGGLVLEFIPPEPGAGALSSFFSLSLDDRQDLITGRFRTILQPGRVVMRLEPERPFWALGRIVETTVARQGQAFQIVSAMADLPQVY